MIGKKKAKKANITKEPTDKLLPKITLALFGRPLIIFVLWIVILAIGIASYTTLLRREGFPSINIPIAIVNGTYIVNDATEVDRDLAKPISELALRQPGVSTVVSQSAGNFVGVTVQYEEGVDSQEATKKLEETINKELQLPSSVDLTYNVPYFGATGGSLEKIDATVSFYRVPSNGDTKALATKAEAAVKYLNEHKPSLVEKFFVQSPFKTAANPVTGEQQEIQQTYDQFGIRKDNETRFYNSVIIGVTATQDVDVIKLDEQLNDVLADLENQQNFREYDATISASFAPSIEESIGEFQRVLLEGLLAVLVVGSIVIAVRASLITVLSMITVITATLGLLYAFGYTLNVITLFALILGLSLIVDDTIIMVEAIDAARRKTKTPREAVRMAVRKVSRAMVAATSTAALSFLPLAFLSGILGTFIRAIPVTIISALAISLLVALVFIPFFSRYLLLGKKQMGEKGVREIAAGIERKIAHGLTWPMHWARGSSKKLWTVGSVAVIAGVFFIGSAGAVFSKVTFNLFPASKDTNAISVNMTFPADTTIQEAQAAALKANDVVGATVGGEFDIASYYGLASEQNANLYVELTPYGERTVTAGELTDRVQANLRQKVPEVNAKVTQVDIGPPASAFNVEIQTENREAGFKLATDVAAYMRDAELTRVSGSTARFTDISVATKGTVVRSDGEQVIQISSGFNADDTTTLVTLAQDALRQEFPGDRIARYGLERDALQFDLGQEADNQESFKGLVIAFPLVLAVIFVLLAIQFRSLLQPLLIFMAIPFSLLGITLGLYLTDNAFSFFAALGFFALIGLSIKNTILLVDYANQARRSGMGPIDAATAALEERFRPLIATSFTAVVSLIPLAIISPFWQGLAMVLIGGLLSSTFLVITVFPYYYLGGEYLRIHVTRRAALLWLVLTVAVGIGLGFLLPTGSAVTIATLFALLLPIANVVRHRFKTTKVR